MKDTIFYILISFFITIYCSVSFADFNSKDFVNNNHLNTTLMAHLSGGACEAVALIGDIILIGSGNSLMTLYVNADSSVQMINSTFVQGQVRDLIVNDDFVYVLSEGNDIGGWYSVISLIDISSNSTDFSVMGSIKFLDNVEDFAYYKNHIFLFCGESAEFNVINIENPALPYIEKVLTMDYMQDNHWPCGPVQFEFKDSLMYYVGDEIAVMLVSDSLEFEIIGRCSAISDPLAEMVIDDSYLYLSQIIGFSIFDISTPESISLVAQVENLDGSPFQSLAIENDHFYLLSELILHIFNVSNPQSPELIASYESDDAFTDIAVYDNRMFITQYFNGLIIFDYEAHSFNPIYKYQSFGFLKDMFIKDNKLYVTSTNSELYVIDISDISSPTIRGYASFSGYPGDIIVNDNAAFITAPEMIQIFDVTDPTNIFKIDTIRINEYTPALDLADGYLYVADGLWGLKIFDISSSVLPLLVGSYSNDRLDAADVLVKGNYAYVLNFAYRQLSIFDISDPTSPTLTKEIQVNVGIYAKSSIWLNRLYIPSSQSITDIYSQKVEIFDISNPGSPIQIGEVDLADNIFSVCGTSGDYLFTISRLNGLRIFHIADPLLTQEMGHYKLTGSYQWDGSMIVQKNIVMIGNNNGLYIIQNDNNSTPSLVNCLSDTTIARNSIFQFEYDVFDVDGDVLSFQIDNHCPGFSIDESLGRLQFTPGIIQKDTSFQLIVAINDTKSIKRDTAEITLTGINAIYNDDTQIPVCFSLEQNYPNPFNSITTISYNLPEISHVKISIYDISGRFINTLVDQQRNPGRYNIYWDASTESSGIYICQFQADYFIQTRKILLIK